MKKFMFICDETPYELTDRLNALVKEGWEAVAFYISHERQRDLHCVWIMRDLKSEDKLLGEAAAT